MSNDDLEFESLAFDDAKRWVDAKRLVIEAVSSLRTAHANDEIAAATERLLLAAASARDYESAAIHLMKRCGYADGIDVPEVGRVRVRWMEDGMMVLEKAP